MKRSDLTEKKIIEAALYLFVRYGYHGTTIDDITRRVGLTKGALYSHFSGKGELLLRIIDQYKIEFLDVMMAHVKAYPGNALAKLHQVISFNSQFALDHQDLVVFLTFLTNELKVDVAFESSLKKVYGVYRSFIRQLIKQGIQEGSFCETLDPDLAALSFIAMVDGIHHQWVLNRKTLNGKKYVSTYRKIFMKGLAK